MHDLIDIMKNGIYMIVELDQPSYTGIMYKSHPELFACKSENFSTENLL